MAQWGRLYCYAQVTDPQMNSWSLVSDANYIRVFNIQTQVWTTSFQYPSEMGEEQCSAEPREGRAFKGETP